MIHITKKSSCCGCTACFNICPKNAISMQPDEEGFLYPVVDQEKCVDCGLCEKSARCHRKKAMRSRRTHTLFDTIIKRSSKKAHQVALLRQFPAMFLKMAALYMAPAMMPI